ncbi:MAG TPA: PDZ domain-containing protein [Gemmatales bacterium]|nr:PDZ domain-containing protein [Gemmatales bacterium]
MKRTLKRLPRWTWVFGCLAILVVGPLKAQDPVPGIPPTREQEIQSIRRQMESLQQRLAELERQTTTTAPTPSALKLPDDFVRRLTWRGIGPANMSGRITAISVYPADPNLYWAATASGGLLKTTNNGVTFEHQFDKENTVSIGDVCVAPSNPEIVWVGTGEYNPRNSVSFGDGVYKSTDGGKTWKHMGLKETFQIGKVIVHPTNPDIVYVGALGRLYGPNAERGLFKTTNGGQSWEKVLYFDENTGVIDMVMHPTEPDTLLVAMWERRRDEFDSFIGDPKPADGIDGYDPVVKWGPHAGIYKTTDGGKNFKRLTQGLPSNQFGRVGLCYFLKDPNTIVAIIDCAKIGMGRAPAGSPNVYIGFFGEATDDGLRVQFVPEESPAAKAGLQPDDLVTSVDGKPVAANPDVQTAISEKKVDDKVKVEFKRGAESKSVEITLGERPAPAGGFGGPGGGTRTRPWAAYYGGQRENVQDRQGDDGHEFGGVYKSTDGGETWTRLNSLNPRPMYFSLIRIDPNDDQTIYVGGISMHRSTDGGKTFRVDRAREVHADYHALWINPKDSRHIVAGSDGGVYVSYDKMLRWDHLNHAAMGQFYHVAVCPRQPYWAFGGLQDNGSWGLPSRGLGGRGPVNEDVLSIGGGDGFVCRIDQTEPDWIYSESQNGVMGRRNLRPGERASIRPRVERGQPPYRFNWNTPFILSHHNQRIFICAGNYVFRSVNRGDDLKIISPEITRTQRGSGTALSESPRNPDVLWAGTDDGAVWVTRDGGKNWTNVSERIGLPGPRWVATLEASRFAEGRCYAAFDGHRSDDDKPYLYVTEDYGVTWKPIHEGLPSFGSTRCLREDVVNPNLLFCGTEFHAFASVDRGQSWTKINNNLPTVAVHEIAVHPTAGEIVAATHGRSLWVLDVTWLRQFTADAAKAPAHLFKPATVVRFRPEPSRGGTLRRFVGQNPQAGTEIFYHLGEKADRVQIKIVDVQGNTVRELTGFADPGLNRVAWNLARTAPRPPGGGAGGGGFGGGGFGGGRGGAGREERAQATAPRPTAPTATAPAPTTPTAPTATTPAAAAAPQQPRRGGFGAVQLVPTGTYRVILVVDGKEYTQTLEVQADPNVPLGEISTEVDELTLEQWLRKIN